jgi:hypothetical protein
MRSNKVKKYSAEVAAIQRRINELVDRKRKDTTTAPPAPPTEAGRENPFDRIRRKIDGDNNQKK